MSNIFEEPDGGKRFWSFMKHARTEKKITGIASLNSGGLELTDSSAIAELLNKHFQNYFFQPGPMKLA